MDKRSPLQTDGPVTTVLDSSRINLHLKSTDRDSALRELVALVVAPGDEKLSRTLFQALKAREELCSTGVDNGIAIPHSRNAMVGLVERPVLAYGRHPSGIEFGALDGKPVRHFFLLCAPNVREHLHVLARLSRILLQPGFNAQLDKATSPDEILACIRKFEQPLQ